MGVGGEGGECEGEDGEAVGGGGGGSVWEGGTGGDCVRLVGVEELEQKNKTGGASDIRTGAQGTQSAGLEVLNGPQCGVLAVQSVKVPSLCTLFLSRGDHKAGRLSCLSHFTRSCTGLQSQACICTSCITVPNSSKTICAYNHLLATPVSCPSAATEATVGIVPELEPAL